MDNQPHQYIQLVTKQINYIPPIQKREIIEFRRRHHELLPASLEKAFDFKGRARRTEFWLFTIINGGIINLLFYAWDERYSWNGPAIAGFPSSRALAMLKLQHPECRRSYRMCHLQLASELKNHQRTSSEIIHRR